jgi:hypothetical protein
VSTRGVVLMLAAVAAVAGASDLGAADAARAPAAVAAPGCTPRAPVLLSRGAAPRRKLRLNLARSAGVTAHATSVERVDSKTTLADGSVQPGSSTRQVAEAFRTGKLAGGQVPYVATLVVSFPGTAGAGSHTRTLTGHLDARNGGAVGAKGAASQMLPGALPDEAVGVGATWRVVDCDQIDSVFAQETRVYTLQSIAGGVVVASYRDQVTIDPAHTDLGTQNVNGSQVDYRLLTLSGTATGTIRLPLARAFAQSSRMVTRLQYSFRASPKTAKSDAITTRLTDTETDTPS